MPYATGLRHRRQATGLKVAQFAAKLGCSRSHYINVEGGWSVCSPELLNLIAQALSCEVEDITVPRVPAESVAA